MCVVWAEMLYVQNRVRKSTFGYQVGRSVSLSRDMDISFMLRLTTIDREC